jgi:hypothetical protein
MIPIIAPNPQLSIAATALPRGTAGQANAVDASDKTGAATRATGSAPATSAFAQNQDRFATLAGTVLDTSGKYSDDQRLQAYSSLLQMGAKGQLQGMDGVSSKLYAKVTTDSDIGTKVAQIRPDSMSAMVAAAQRGQSLAVAKLKFFAGLPPQDQKVDFALVETGSATSIADQPMDFDSFRNHLVTDASQDLPERTGKALKTLSSATAGSAWGAQVVSLLKVLDPSGSGVAGSLTADPKPPASYRRGSIFTQVA